MFLKLETVDCWVYIALYPIYNPNTYLHDVSALSRRLAHLNWKPLGEFLSNLSFLFFLINFFNVLVTD